MAGKCPKLGHATLVERWFTKPIAGQEYLLVYVFLQNLLKNADRVSKISCSNDQNIYWKLFHQNI